MSRFTFWSIAGYFAFTAALVAGLWYARRETIATFDNPRAQAEWDEWSRKTVELSTSTRPAEWRRPTLAPEPPLLILMRDNFAACVVTTVLMGTIGYWFVVLAGRGAFRTPDPATAAGARR
jgi:hypothetical protein